MTYCSGCLKRHDPQHCPYRSVSIQCTYCGRVGCHASAHKEES